MSRTNNDVLFITRQIEEMQIHLCHAERGTLLIVSVEDADLEEKLVDELQSRLRGQVEVNTFHLSSETWSLASYLRALPPPAVRSVVMVHGLSELSNDIRRQSVDSLNLDRERLRWAGRSIVLWVRPQIFVRLPLDAPDFWAWRSGTFEFSFSIDPALRLEMIAKVRSSRPESLEDKKRYFLGYVIAANQWVDFRGIMQVRNIVRLPLDTLYVPLSLEFEEQEVISLESPVYESQVEGIEQFRKKKIKGTLKHKEIQEKRTQVVEIGQALRRYRRIAVLGDPGSGKSTLLKFLSVSFARGKEVTSKLLELEEEILPILVPISSFAMALQTDSNLKLQDFLGSYYENLGVKNIWPLFSNELQKGSSAVLLDGLDEVINAEQRLLIVKAINTFVSCYPKNIYIVTSRIAGYQAAPVGENFKELRIKPFTIKEMKTFAYNWYVAFERSLGKSDLLNQKVKSRADNLVEAITSHPSIEKLSSVPLLLTILALIHYQGTRLPERRVELYRLCVEALAETWNLARSLSDHPIELLLGDRRLDERWVVELLAPIAYSIHCHQPGGLIKREHFHNLLYERFVQQGESEEKAKQYATEFISLVQEQMGLISERGVDQFGFVHLTFEEYLSARYIADKEHPIKLIKSYLHDPRWQEVVLLTAGILSRERATQFVKNIKNCKSPYNSILHRDLLLASCCLAENISIESSLQEEIMSELLELALTSKYEFLWEKCRETLGALRAITVKDSLIAILVNKLQDKNPKRREWAAMLIGDLRSKSPEVIKALLIALKDKDEYVRMVATEALGNLGNASPEVIQALLTALKDEDEYVRMTAAKALINLGNASPGVIKAFLVAVKRGHIFLGRKADYAFSNLGNVSPNAIQAFLTALKDEDWDVREGAAYVLGKLGNASDDVIQALLIALKDKNEYVRRKAAYALGKLGNASPDVIQALLTALKDEGSYVRVAAAEALVKLGNASPKVIQALLTTLKDKDEEVRMVAAEALCNLLSLQNQRVRKALFSNLRSRDSYVRASTALLLARLGVRDRSIMNYLARRLRFRLPSIIPPRFDRDGEYVYFAGEKGYVYDFFFKALWIMAEQASGEVSLSLTY